MTFEVVVGGGLVLLVAGLVIWGLTSLKDHGREEEKVSHAKKEIEDAGKRADAASAAPANQKEAAAILRDRMERAKRRLRELRGDAQ